jgi:mRNA interferase RelE/StbE
MRWEVSLSNNAQKFLRANNISKENILGLIQKTVREFKGEVVNIDIKKLKGGWTGFYRIRKGKLRIIVEFDFDNFRALIEEIDWRGNVYN